MTWTLWIICILTGGILAGIIYKVVEYAAKKWGEKQFADLFYGKGEKNDG